MGRLTHVSSPARQSAALLPPCSPTGLETASCGAVRCLPPAGSRAGHRMPNAPRSSVGRIISSRVAEPTTVQLQPRVERLITRERAHEHVVLAVERLDDLAV